MRASSSSKKASLTRRFTDLINQKTTRLPSSKNAGTKDGSTTPPVQTTTPSSSSSSPHSLQSRITTSPQSPRFTFDEHHRLPVTFLPFVSTDTPFSKGLDVFGESKNSPKTLFEFGESPVEVEENWFSMADDRSSAFETLASRTRSHSKTTLSSPTKQVRIGWICEDGFKPIMEYDCD